MIAALLLFYFSSPFAEHMHTRSINDHTHSHVHAYAVYTSFAHSPNFPYIFSRTTIYRGQFLYKVFDFADLSLHRAHRL